MENVRRKRTPVLFGSYRPKGWDASLPKLVVGRTYTLLVKERNEKEAAKIVPYRKKLTGLYRYHALFENEKGIRQSYIYWDLARMIKEG